MGAGGGVRQGLRITTLDVLFTPNTPNGKKGTLVRTSEVAVVGDPGVPEAGAVAIRSFGLKIGMRFRNNHEVVSVKWASGNVLPAPGAFKSATKNAAIITLCEDVFGSAGQWYGFKIKAADIPPLSYPAADDRLYFIVKVKNFRPYHPMDFHEVPAVAVLGNLPDFTEHYALGMAIFTVGKASSSMQFDSEVIGSQ